MDTLSLSCSGNNLSHFFPPQLVLQWYDEADRSVQYRDRDLPRPVVFLGLLKYAVNGFGNLGHAFADAALELQPEEFPLHLSKGSVTQARRRLPVEVLRRAYAHIGTLVDECRFASPIKGFRVLCLDGTDFAVADTPENREVYGLPGSRTGETAFPLIQAALVMDAATHLFVAERHGAYGRQSETALADNMLAEVVESGVLLEADRGFASYERIKRVGELGGDMLVRVKRTWILPKLEELEDGSFISAIRGEDARNCRAIPRGEHPSDLRVRVIEYCVCESGGKVREFRLVTTVLDPRKLPASTAVQGYHIRWGIEVGIRELKWLRERFRIPQFPGKSRASVEQEYWGLLLAHSVLRCAMAFAAKAHKLDPTRLSLSGTRAVLERYLPHLRRLPPADMPEWIARMFRAIAREQLPVPNGRSCPRVVKKWRRAFPSKQRSQPTSTYPDYRLELRESTGTAA